MEFKINKNILLKNLYISSFGVSTKNIIPILEGIKFTIKDSKVTLTSSNNDISIMTYIDKTNIESISLEGTCVIPGRFLLDMVKKTNEDSISLCMFDDNKIKISTNKYSNILNSYDISMYPVINFERTREPIVISKAIIKELINKTIFATSNDEGAGVLCGINFLITGNLIEATATDLSRLNKLTLKLDKEANERVNIVIYNKNLLSLKAILDDDGDIDLSVFENKVMFSYDNVCFQTRLLSGVYPNTNKYIPSSFKQTIRVNSKEAYDALDRMSLLTDKVFLKLEESELVLSSGFVKIGNGVEKIKVEIENDEEINTFIDVRFLMESIKALEEEEFVIKYNGTNDPIIIASAVKNNYIQLILPIMN